MRSGGLTIFELLAVVYFAGLALAAGAAPVPWRRRGMVMGLALTVAAAIVAVASVGSDALRDWMPHAYLVAGYWMPALLTRAGPLATAFERWLCESDRRLRPAVLRLPAPLVHTTELAYLLCYPLVPASFLVVWRMGSPDDVARFWVAVLIAGYACYATLPWLVSRPPRLVTGAAATCDLGAVNAFVLGRVSHQWNTFPSGHVAVSLAAAAAVWAVSPTAGIFVGVIAAAVAVGAVTGRYHYVVDVAVGTAVAAVAAVLAGVAA
jgi:hypothetical protein